MNPLIKLINDSVLKEWVVEMLSTLELLVQTLQFEHQNT